MRFFADIDGLLWECNSVGDYFSTLFACCLGKIIAWIIFFGAVGLAIWYIFL